MSSWQNVKLTKCQVDKMSGWQNVKLTKCQVDEMSSWQNVKLAKCQVDKMSSWQNVKLTKYQVDKMSSLQNAMAPRPITRLGKKSSQLRSIWIWLLKICWSSESQMSKLIKNLGRATSISLEINSKLNWLESRSRLSWDWVENESRLSWEWVKIE